MNLTNREILCLAKGGSHAYGLETPTSDVDWRGVFVNTDVSYLVGLKRDEILVEQNDEKDLVMTEFRHALRLLRGANTQMIELLFSRFVSPNEILNDSWWLTQYYRDRLVNSEKLFSSLRGYMQGELKLANGERTGKLGGKRKEAIDKFGFSPKNFVQLFRLAWAGKIYFEKNYFPVNVKREDYEFSEYLLNIKTNPSSFNKEQLNQVAAEFEEKLKLAFENRETNNVFSDEVANLLCLKVYGPLINKL